MHGLSLWDNCAEIIVTKIEVQKEIREFLDEFGIDSKRVSISIGDSARVWIHPNKVKTDIPSIYFGWKEDWDDCDLEIVLQERDLENNYIARYVRMHEVAHIIWFYAIKECKEVVDQILDVMKDTVKSACAKLLDIKVRKRRYNNDGIRPKRYELFLSSWDYTYEDAELFAMWFAWRMA